MNSFITSAESLVTTHEQIRSGFLEIALEKNRVGDPYVRQAFAFRSMVAHTHSPDELLNISNVRTFMLRACLETHLSIMKRFSSMLAMAI